LTAKHTDFGDRYKNPAPGIYNTPEIQPLLETLMVGELKPTHIHDTRFRSFSVISHSRQWWL
jgi:hypothetical protein